MAAGDPYFDCSHNNAITLEMAIRDMIRDDGAGNPVWTTNSATVLEKWFDCSTERHNVSTEQALKLMIVQDASGNPQWNVSNL